MSNFVNYITGILLGLLSSLTVAQSYPSKPLRFIVVFPPSDGTDATMRSMSQNLAGRLGQPVVVDNRPGGNFVIGAPAIPGKVSLGPNDLSAAPLTRDYQLMYFDGCNTWGAYQCYGDPDFRFFRSDEPSRSEQQGAGLVARGIIQHKLEAGLRTRGFEGPIGVDAFVYRDSEGKTRLKPVVEFNPRYTMGRLTLELMRSVAPGAYGRFRLVGKPQLKALGSANFEEFRRKLAREHPLVCKGDARAQIQQGAVMVTDSTRAESVCGVFEVGLRRGFGVSDAG